jgi:hypothetical protein
VPPRELLILFTAGWLGGLGALTALNAQVPWPARVIGVAEVAAAVAWFVPRARPAGFGAMLAILAVAALYHFTLHQVPGPLLFYAAVVLYFAVEETRLKPVGDDGGSTR